VILKHTLVLIALFIALVPNMCWLPAAAAPTHKSTDQVFITALRTEYETNPLGIDARQPRLSWQLQSTQRGVMQSAYQIRVADSEHDLQRGTNLVWDSGKVDSPESIQRGYGGPTLKSRQRYYWQVRVWDGKRHASRWSKPAFWEMGLLQVSDWVAKWIEPDLHDDVPPTPAVLPNGVKMTPPDDPSLFHPAPMLRREFRLNGTVKSARLYVSAHGLYKMDINGIEAGDSLFTPGWTSYHKRLQYQTYDVSALLHQGKNAMAAELGDGWYRGFVGGHGWREVWGNHLALLAQLQITYTDGRSEIISTDSQWKAATGPITRSDILDGESYDARLEKLGWKLPGYKDRDWASVHVVDEPKDILVATAGPPVRRVEEVKPIRIFTTPAGDTVVDLGQNMVGFVRLKITGAAGTTVTLRHFEVLDPKGNVYTANLRGAAQTDRFTLKGQGTEVFHPHFTFHGFRYVAVSGYPGQLTPDAITGVVVHSDMNSAGELVTSNELVNKLQHAIIWGQKGNFVDVPMDCPQRNERLGWSADAAISARTTIYNYDVASLLTRWLKDLSADQLADGNVPRVIPDVRRGEQSLEGYGRAGWGDAAVVIPWTIYLEYGDSRILEEHYESMARWLEFERRRAGDDYVWDGEEQYGDWVAVEETDEMLMATAIFAHSTDLLSRIARVLGKDDDALRYRELFEKIKVAFQNKFVNAGGEVGNKTQTAMLLALKYDLLPEDLRSVVARNLVEDVRIRGHLTTGFIGTEYLNPMLSRSGFNDEAYRLLLQEKFPSWMYMIKNGATTIWERWDGLNPQGTFQQPIMNSFNHRVLGSVGEWLWGTMAGIDLDEARPGYRHVIIRPQPGGGITWVRASHETMYGRVSSAWELKDGEFQLRIAIPPNTTATVYLPAGDPVKITANGHQLKQSPGVQIQREEKDQTVLNVGSGEYSFVAPIQQALQKIN
jgi:alpha-L-rhamnosidase